MCRSTEGARLAPRAKPRFANATLAAAAATALACSPTPGSGPSAASPGAASLHPGDALVVQDQLLLADAPSENIDSLAIWTGETQGLLLATAKETDRLWVLDVEGKKTSTPSGGPGAQAGQFDRPNGIAVVADLALVVERDNHRVQALRLPDLTPVGVFGGDVLRRPYGLAARQLTPDQIEVWVTDNYEVAAPGQEVAPGDDPEPAQEGTDLAGRLQRFVVHPSTLELQSHSLHGPTAAPTALAKVESLALDARNDVLLVAEEHTPIMSVQVFDLDGNHRKTLGREWLSYEPEGIGLWECGAGGAWIVTDQGDTSTVFHVLDRSSFAHLGAFRGRTTANTDGIALTSTPLAGYPHGALFAVHDDSGVAAIRGEELTPLLPAECTTAD